MFFYIYGFLGWVYESILVSFENKKITNRGFVKGPILPIYGIGAATILCVTKPFIDYPVAVFFVGLVSATILEYAAGYILEKTFKVRYWDYSARFANINGYICFLSVIVWGFFSILMVYVLHEHVMDIVDMIPTVPLFVFMCIVTAVFAVDLFVSFKEAYDIRAIYVKMEKLKADLTRENITEKLEVKKQEIIQTMDNFKYKHAKILKHNPKATLVTSYKELYNEIKNLHNKANKKPQKTRD